MARVLGGSWKALFGSAIAVLIWGAAPGCVPSAGSYCRKVCDCTGCDEDSEASCVDQVSDAQRRATNKECGDKFGAYFACLDSQTKCVDKAIDADGCETEAEALTACAGDIGLGFGASCQTMCERSQKECGGGGDCAQSCANTDKLAQDTGCTSEYSALLNCFTQQEDICNAGNFCQGESNDFVNCFITFCNQNPGTPGC